MSRDLRIVESGGHGKACRGAKRTSTFQVREHGVIQDAYCLVKQFRFKVGSFQSRNAAIERARRFVRENR